MTENLNRIPRKITGGLRSALDLRTRLEQCIAIQRRICEKAEAGTSAREQATNTLGLLMASLAANALDIASCGEVISRHRRAYGLKKNAASRS